MVDGNINHKKSSIWCLIPLLCNMHSLWWKGFYLLQLIALYFHLLWQTALMQQDTWRQFWTLFSTRLHLLLWIFSVLDRTTSVPATTKVKSSQPPSTESQIPTTQVLPLEIRIDLQLVTDNCPKLRVSAKWVLFCCYALYNYVV